MGGWRIRFVERKQYAIQTLNEILHQAMGKTAKVKKGRSDEHAGEFHNGDSGHASQDM